MIMSFDYIYVRLKTLAIGIRDHAVAAESRIVFYIDNRAVIFIFWLP